MNFHILTLGCKTNQYESEEAKDQLLSYGHNLVKNTDEADLVIVNTCSVTHIADRKSRQQINKVVMKNPSVSIVITGCTIENPQAQLPQMNNNFCVLKKELPIFLKRYSKKSTGLYDHNLFLKRKVRKLLKIQDGCDYFCSYCIIPFVRSNKCSYSPERIQKEFMDGLDRGIKEFVLTGINIGTYSYNNIDLAGLLRLLVAIPGEYRIRLGSMEPNLVTNQLLDLIKTEPKICPHLHLPLQAASNSLLNRMNRKYSMEHYEALLEKIIGLKRSVSITTDLIVGFPGETQQEFHDTLDMINSGRFLDVHLFPFSPRQGTKAHKMNPKVTEILKKERMKIGLECVKSNKLHLLEEHIGKDNIVLIEAIKNGEAVGFSGHYVRTKFKAKQKHKVNELVRVDNKKIFQDEKTIGIFALAK